MKAGGRAKYLAGPSEKFDATFNTVAVEALSS
jgi:hypothetical protein